MSNDDSDFDPDAEASFVGPPQTDPEYEVLPLRLECGETVDETAHRFEQYAEHLRRLSEEGYSEVSDPFAITMNVVRPIGDE